jgi:predicted nucleotidyltransferase
MTFGLSSQAIELLQDVFHHHPEITHVQIFGSRALGHYRNNSDIDLVIRDNISAELLASITLEMDELPLPYLFDIKCYPHLSHEGLREHIDLFAKDLYLKAL